MDSQNESAEVLKLHGIELHEDLRFLLGVAVNLEHRNEKWRNRTARSLSLALTMNAVADQQRNNLTVVAKHGQPVKAYPADPDQLAAAVLAHDLGMGFLPFDMLNKKGPLSSKERKNMQAHIKSAADLIHRMAKWEDARQMILGHHERVDGSGYPNQYVDDEISNGAKILAIVDTFTAQGRTNIMHGVMEIHRFTGTHFSEPWVKHFDTAVKILNERSAATKTQTSS